VKEEKEKKKEFEEQIKPELDNAKQDLKEKEKQNEQALYEDVESGKKDKIENIEAHMEEKPNLEGNINISVEIENSGIEIRNKEVDVIQTEDGSENITYDKEEVPALETINDPNIKKISEIANDEVTDEIKTEKDKIEVKKVVNKTQIEENIDEIKKEDTLKEGDKEVSDSQSDFKKEYDMKAAKNNTYSRKEEEPEAIVVDIQPKHEANISEKVTDDYTKTEKETGIKTESPVKELDINILKSENKSISDSDINKEAVKTDEAPELLNTNLNMSGKDNLEKVAISEMLNSGQQSSVEANKSDDGYKIDASDADDEEDITIEKTRTKSRSVSRGRSEGKVNDSSGDEKDKKEQVAPPPKPKSRSTSRSKKKTMEVDSKITNDRSKSKSIDRGEAKKSKEPEPKEQPKTKPVAKEQDIKTFGDETNKLEETFKLEKPKRRPSSTSRNQEPTTEEKNQQQVSVANKDAAQNNELTETLKEECNKVIDTVETSVTEASEQKSVPSLTTKSRSSSKTRVEFGETKEVTTGGSGSKGNSRQTSRTGSPVGILKGGKRSRDASRDRAELAVPGFVEDKGLIDTEEPLKGKPLSRTGSLKKSGSFSKRVGLIDKKKISFDDDVDIEKFEKASEPIATAKELFAAIADTSLESGLTSLKQKSRSTSRERPGSRGSSSGFPQQEPREFPEGGEFEDEDELMIILDTGTSSMTNIPFQGSRSISRERAGSQGSKQTTETNRLDSGVPELEIVEKDHEIIKNQTAEVPDEDFEDRRPLSSAARPPSSTGFSHLDEFERRLAEMENELESEEVLEQNLKRGENMWNLSPDLLGTTEPGTIEDTDKTMKDPNEVEDLYATVGQKQSTKPTKIEDLYAEISTKRKTDDGFFLNTDTELVNVDHSCLQGDVEEDVGSEYLFDDDTGQRVRRSKKVSFAESDERYEIERQGQTKGLGGALSKIFSLSTHKPSKDVIESEVKVEVDETVLAAIETTGDQPSDQDTSARAFLSAMTGGIIGPSRSPEPERKEGGSLFGALLRRGRKGSRSGSQQGSRQSSGDRSSVQDVKIVGDKTNQPIKDAHVVSEDEGRASSVASGDNYDGTMSDAGSESSFVGRLKKLKRKKPKVQPADFDELFARGLALSAQLESETQEDPFKAKLVSEGISRTDGTDEDTFRFSQKDDGIGFAEKVTAFLDDQASNPRPSVDMEPRERGRRRHRHRGDSQGDKSKSETGTMSRSQSDDKRKRSREYTKPEDIKLSPQVPRDLYTGAQLTDNATFLAKVTEFVTNNEVDCQYTQQIWPAIPGPDDKLPPLKDPDTLTQQTLDRISPLPGLAPPSPSSPAGASETRLAPSPGKAFLEAVTGLEAFGPSIEGAPDDDIKTASNSVKVAEYIHSNYGVSVGSPPPRDDEPADKGLPLQLMPDKLMANEEFYEKLRSGLKDISTPERLLEDQSKDEAANYQAYSHHLGRAEFGSLQRKKTGGVSSRASAATSRDPSGDRLTGRPGLSQQSSGDKLNKGPLSSDPSGDKLKPGVRSISRASDYSGGLPDLEVEDVPDYDFDIRPSSTIPPSPTMQRTRSLEMSPIHSPIIMDQSTDVMTRKHEVLKDIDEHKQQIKDAKAWIQNGLMTVVGVGVMAYLQTLEQMGGT